MNELERNFQYYLEYEYFPTYEINLMASKLEELRDQEKEIKNSIERLRLEASN